MTNSSPSCANCEQLRVQLAEKDVELAALKARIEEMNRHDALTGTLNRRTLLEFLQVELQRAQRTGHPFCFGLIDLDHFRSINSQHGHTAGDAVLKTAAATSVKLLRTIDRFGRLGEETFGIILPATWLDQGIIAMKRLSKAFADANWDDAAAGLKMTFSGGLTTNAMGDTVESMMKRAEQALQQARAEGGNRTILAEEPLPIAPPES